jgi:DNA-directed RNA polymerase sigma subunit (sigma70/sigma32)
MQLINDWIKNERDRHILKRRLIDGIRLEPLAEEVNLTVDRVKQIVYTDIALIQQHI